MVKLVVKILIGVGLGVLAVGWWWREVAWAPTGQVSEEAESVRGEYEVVMEDLTIPWEIGWLPSGEMLVTERAGKLLLFDEKKNTFEIAGVEHVGEGGLQGLAVDPDFRRNNFIYLYLTTRAEAGLINRVERYVLRDKELGAREVLVDNIPGARFHDGGRIEFGPDGKLYVTVGDATDEPAAQDAESYHGTILQVDVKSRDVKVYSYGHRNPQGLAWDEDGNMWATEHGRSGVRSGLDEVNLIVAGGNYGWPDSEGDTVLPGTIGPKVHSGPEVTWAPAGLEVVGDYLYFTGLRGESLYVVPKNGQDLGEVQTRWFQEFGRLRAVRLGPDGWLYVSTSNTDGRGKARAGDDKIIRIAI